MAHDARRVLEPVVPNEAQSEKVLSWDELPADADLLNRTILIRMDQQTIRITMTRVMSGNKQRLNLAVQSDSDPAKKQLRRNDAFLLPDIIVPLRVESLKIDRKLCFNPNDFVQDIILETRDSILLEIHIPQSWQEELPKWLIIPTFKVHTSPANVEKLVAELRVQENVIEAHKIKGNGDEVPTLVKKIFREPNTVELLFQHWSPDEVNAVALQASRTTSTQP